MISVGANARSSFTLMHFENNEVNDIYKDLISRNDIFFITSERFENYYKTFMKEHYNFNVKSKLESDDFNVKITKFYIEN